MANIMAIDSSTEACSVALAFNGVLVKRYKVAARKHAELILPMVDEVLKEAGIQLDELDAIACCVGPGAFTGLRIAISVAQGLAYGANLSCIPVSSLQALAYDVFRQSDADACLVALDARMNEVYFSAFMRGDNNLPVEIYPQQVVPAEQIELSGKALQSISLQPNKLVKVGNAWGVYQFSDQINSFDASQLNIQFPNAEMMLPIANAAYKNQKLLKPEFLQPVYLRNNVAKKKSEQK